MSLLQGRDERGIPLKSDYDNMAPAPKSLHVIYSIFTFVFAAIGVGVGFLAMKMAGEKTLHKMDMVTEYGLGPLYLALFALVYTFQMVSATMGTARRDTKVNVPDQHIYRVYGGPANGSIVLMDLEGDHGKFNRGQRALANLEEHLPLFLAKVLSAGFVFPLLVACLAVFFGIFRVIGASGYVSDAKARMKGNMPSMLCSGCLDGLVIFIGCLATYKEYF
eukprot:TRINITY_DN8265_c0_g1_i1.p1 TRINITY_DN8265_c0_g1~~TRINITY_DN8265_c0_g1_i1.p1  ORF type:complete len:220 (-),score=39.54 TRINITY_DN8265_c0_g1_i1:167-826(-)